MGSAASRSPSVLPEGKLTSPPKANVTALPSLSSPTRAAGRRPGGPGARAWRVAGRGMPSATAQSPPQARSPVRRARAPAIDPVAAHAARHRGAGLGDRPRVGRHGVGCPPGSVSVWRGGREEVGRRGPTLRAGPQPAAGPGRPGPAGDLSVAGRSSRVPSHHWTGPPGCPGFRTSRRQHHRRGLRRLVLSRRDGSPPWGTGPRPGGVEPSPGGMGPWRVVRRRSPRLRSTAG